MENNNNILVEENIWEIIGKTRNLKKKGLRENIIFIDIL